MNGHDTTKTERDFTDVLVVIQMYFDGLYFADVEKLESIFHPDAFLKAPNHRRSLTTWLKDVATRETPSEVGGANNFKVLSVEVIQDQAMVKVDCPLFEHKYVDFLGLLKEQGQWKIVNKMYTDVRSQ